MLCQVSILKKLYFFTVIKVNSVNNMFALSANEGHGILLLPLHGCIPTHEEMEGLFDWWPSSAYMA